MSRVRVRYAPSPTGYLHIGNARTALFNYLFAKHYEGDFILRIEDTDIARNIEGGEESQYYYLNWLGIVPDESPEQPKPQYAPYRQSERIELYQKYADELLDKGYAYKCFCTSEELEEDYQRQNEAGFASTRYNRHCLSLSPQEIAENEKAGKPFSIRVRVPDNETYEFVDMIRGKVSFESKDIGDWVLIKSNGIPTYNYACVIDDHTMDISHVFRGEEHLSNTPKQIMIYRMLAWETPLFGHMTLIVNQQHKKLSKRDNDIMQFMSQYKEAGYLPDAMFNFMALLGWSPEGEKEIFTKEELIAEFSEKRLSKSPSMFDQGKLAWVNNKYIKELSMEAIVNLCLPFLQADYDISDKSAEWLNDLIVLYQPQLSCGQDIVELCALFFADQDLSEEAQEVLNWETTPILKESFKVKIDDLSWTKEDLAKTIDRIKEETGIKGKALFMGLRVLTTKITHGPDLTTTLYLLGKEKVVRNLESLS